MNQTKIRRKVRVRKNISAGVRVSVVRSNRFFSAQLIDLKTGKVIFGLIDYKVLGEKAKGKTKTERANLFGTMFGEQVKKLKLDKLAFDRSGYRYHGRVKAFVEGLRSSQVSI